MCSDEKQGTSIRNEMRSKVSGDDKLQDSSTLVFCLQAGEELISLRHPRSTEVKKSSTTLELCWEELKKAMATRGKALEDNRDFLEFLQKVEEVEAWIRHKVGGGRTGGWVGGVVPLCSQHVPVAAGGDD